MDILWLGDPMCNEQGLVGGKVANLSRLAACQRVPPGFCLTTVAYDRIKAGGIDLASPFWRLPAPIEQQIAAAYRELSGRCGQDEPAVAVRSSAADEDGRGASFAGQHDTYLNISGIPDIIDAVRRCFASGWSDRAVEYRRHRGLPQEDLRMAVLVQELVLADVSAVVFSANPVTGNREEIVINASWGLGESIVGGTVTPDTYIVRREDLALQSNQIADKLRMTIVDSKGTREVEVPRFFRERPALDDDKVVEAARLAKNLEAILGWPVDVECSYRGEELYLLQCRPITTLA